MGNNSESVKQMVEQLYTDRDQTGDAIFVVESQQIRAHRNVLAALSPKYKAQFYGPNPDEGEIRIPNVSAAAFNEFLQFFYKESVDLTVENFETVLDLARQSLVDGFIEICVNFLKKSITTSNVCSVYRLAIFNDVETLRLDCEKQISSKTVEVFGSDDFLQCDRDMLCHILNVDTFNCTETDVFNACIAWARAHSKQKDLCEKKSENLRAALGVAIHLVRFSSMNAEEFAILHRSNEGFFTADEQTEILYITTQLKDFTPKIFNNTPRTPYNIPEGRLAMLTGLGDWSQVCNLFERIIKRRNSVPTKISCDGFDFRCSKPIRLHGFVLGFQFDNSIRDCFRETVVMNVHFANAKNADLTPLGPEFNVYQSPFQENETIILFENPINSIDGFDYRCQLPTIPLNYQLNLKSKVIEENILFKFRSIDRCWITRIFFDS